MSNVSENMLSELQLLSQRFLMLHQAQVYQRQLLLRLDNIPLAIIIGQRGVGKTTFIIQHLLETVGYNMLSPEILYIPTDHFLITKTSLYEIAESFYLLGGKRIVFDEIHKYKNWARELKSICDTFPALKIIASGSSALEISKAGYDLTRRAIVMRMPGCSFREYLALHHQILLPSYSLEEILEHHSELTHTILQKMAIHDRKILALFQHYLQIGYYPYYLQYQDPNLYFITLEQNLHATLESDLPTVYPALTGHSIQKMKLLMSFIASTVPFTANLSKLRQLIDVGDERTLKTYLNYLSESSLIRVCLKASQQIRKIEAPEKIYLDNPNQLYALCPSQPNIGTIRELFFLSMLAFQHEVGIPIEGDFRVDSRWTFEIGGRKKSFHQIKNLKESYLVCDEIEQGIQQKVPLWLFGFLY